MFSLLADAVQRLKKQAPARRLRNLRVETISAVARPSNRRRFLIVKCADAHEGSERAMGTRRAKTFDECLAEGHEEKPVKKAATVDLGHIDFKKLADDILKQAIEDWRSSVSKAAKKSAVDELEEKVAALIHAQPQLTRQLAVNQAFESTPGLYARTRAETTIDKHGRTLREAYDRVQVVGKAAGESVEAEIERGVGAILAKEGERLTREQAMDFLFSQNRSLYERWRTERA